MLYEDSMSETEYQITTIDDAKRYADEASNARELAGKIRLLIQDIDKFRWNTKKYPLSAEMVHLLTKLYQDYANFERVSILYELQEPKLTEAFGYSWRWKI
jgi:hypothetical protein